MTQIMNFAIEKAFFEKKNVVALIEALPEYMQEDALLIAVDSYKIPECAKLGARGIKNNKIYIVDDFKPFQGVHVVNINDGNDSFYVNITLWERFNKDYQQYLKEQQQEYLRKEAELQKEYREKLQNEYKGQLQKE